MSISDDPPLVEVQSRWHATFKAYLIGFLLSLILTFAAYFLVTEKIFKPSHLFVAIVILGLLQAFAQLIFFFHIHEETAPHWQFLIFALMFITLLIVVIGTLWIIFDLNARVMPEMGGSG